MDRQVMKPYARGFVDDALQSGQEQKMFRMRGAFFMRVKLGFNQTKPSDER
jgi:hypothetical protein